MITTAIGLLAACARQPSPPAEQTIPLPTAKSPFVTGSACIVELTYRDVAFDRLHDTPGPGCGIDTAISLIQSPIAMSRPVEVDCSLARQLSLWDTDVVEPAAERLFGAKVGVIDHYGGYVCRGIVGNHSRLSEHAKGLAIDVAGFELSNGIRISVEHDWREGGRKQAFLREIAKSACGLFNVVLTPNTNADHQNHFHLDIGPYKDCSP